MLTMMTMMLLMVLLMMMMMIMLMVTIMMLMGLVTMVMRAKRKMGEGSSTTTIKRVWIYLKYLLVAECFLPIVLWILQYHWSKLTLHGTLLPLQLFLSWAVPLPVWWNKFLRVTTLVQLLISVSIISKIQLAVYYHCCVLIGRATTRLYVIAH